MKVFNVKQTGLISLLKINTRSYDLVAPSQAEEECKTI